MSTQDVFSTLPLELTDMVWSYLSLEELLKIHTVSRGWYVFLKEAPKVSRVLFRYPESMRLNKDPAAKHRYLSKRWQEATTVTEDGDKIVRYFYHPLFYQIAHPLWMIEDGSWRVVLYRAELKDTFGSQNKEVNPAASWRDMFLTYPPLQKASVELFLALLSYQYPNKYWEDRPYEERIWIKRRVHVENLEGITLGDLFHLIVNNSNPPSHRYPTASEWSAVAPEKWIDHLPLSMQIAVQPLESPAVGCEEEEELTWRVRGVGQNEEDVKFVIDRDNEEYYGDIGTCGEYVELSTDEEGEEATKPWR
jgi:hypothetical protein